MAAAHQIDAASLPRASPRDAQMIAHRGNLVCSDAWKKHTSPQMRQRRQVGPLSVRIPQTLELRHSQLEVHINNGSVRISQPFVSAETTFWRQETTKAARHDHAQTVRNHDALFRITLFPRYQPHHPHALSLTDRGISRNRRTHSGSERNLTKSNKYRCDFGI